MFHKVAASSSKGLVKQKMTCKWSRWYLQLLQKKGEKSSPLFSRIKKKSSSFSLCSSLLAVPSSGFLQYVGLCTWRCKRWCNISDATWSTHPFTLVIQPSTYSCLPQQQIGGLVQLVHLVFRFFSDHFASYLAVQIFHCFKNVEWSSLTLYKWSSSVKTSAVSSTGYLKSVHGTFIFI